MKLMTATDFFGRFAMDAVPRDALAVPSLAEIRFSYGEKMPAYGLVNQYLPVRARITRGNWNGRSK